MLTLQAQVQAPVSLLPAYQKFPAEGPLALVHLAEALPLAYE